MWNSLKTTNNSHFIHTQLKYLPTPPKPNPNRTKSLLNTDSYNSSLSRAFSHSKQLAYFNPDLQYLITLTYKQNLQDSLTTLYDIKQFLKKERRTPDNKPIKYIYVLEVQKRGAIHVHLIANTPFQTYTNKNGHQSLLNWQHGFSSVLHIKQLDNDFRPYLYLFKYFKKAERVGGSFIHTSRNFDKIKKVDYGKYIERLSGENALYEEDFRLIENDKQLNHIIKKYYRLENNFYGQE